MASLIPASDSVRDHIPLEQGLRPALFRMADKSRNVRDHIPLEQGLRHGIAYEKVRDLSQRPYSIRTRIKTVIRACMTTYVDRSETIFH